MAQPPAKNLQQRATRSALPYCHYVNAPVFKTRLWIEGGTHAPLGRQISCHLLVKLPWRPWILKEDELQAVLYMAGNVCSACPWYK